MEELKTVVTDAERLQSVEEMAAYLGVSKETIRGWVKKGSIPFLKVGRQYKFRLSEIDEWLNSGESADADK